MAQDLKCSQTMGAPQQYSMASFDKSVNGGPQKRSKKTKTISYRVTEEEYAQIERAALLMSERPNDWCRRMTVTKAHEGSGMSRTERSLQKDIARVRYLMEATFGMLFGSNEVPDTHSKNMMAEVNQQPDRIADDFSSF